MPKSAHQYSGPELLPEQLWVNWLPPSELTVGWTEQLPAVLLMFALARAASHRTSSP
jgi:hypothetical protein